MKKIIALFLCITLLFSFCACGKKSLVDQIERVNIDYNWRGGDLLVSLTNNSKEVITSATGNLYIWAYNDKQPGDPKDSPEFTFEGTWNPGETVYILFGEAEGRRNGTRTATQNDSNGNFLYTTVTEFMDFDKSYVFYSTGYSFSSINGEAVDSNKIFM